MSKDYSSWTTEDLISRITELESGYNKDALISEVSGADCHIAPLSRVTSREVQPHEQTTCSHGIPLRQTFLVLAPVCSSSFPAKPTETRSSSVSAPAPAKKPQTFEVQPLQKERRSSSASSSSSGRYRFLKLGPVHFGGEPGELDYVEIPEE